MNTKRIFSFLLIFAMVLTIIPTSYAKTSPYDEGTLVRYNGQADEAYTITVPALLLPGESGTVTLTGTWASDRVVNVTSDSDVTLTNSIDSNDKKVLDVSFVGIQAPGSNTKALSFSESVAVETITNAIFGIWSGTFYYNVSIEDYESVDAAKNEYGFYYNVPYIHNYEEWEGYGGEFSEGFVFFEDGTMMSFIPYSHYDDNGNSINYIDGLFAYESEWTWEYDTTTNILKESRFIFDYFFAEDGESFVRDDVVYTAMGNAHGVYYHREYISDDGDSITFIPGEPDWWAKEYIATDVQFNYYVSIDGMVLIAGDKLYYREGYGHGEEIEPDEYGLFDANGVQLAGFNELTNKYKLSLSFGSHNELGSKHTLMYLIETYPELSTGTKLVISPEVSYIGQYALAAGGNYITELVLPNTIKDFDHYTFTGLAVEELILPNSLERVGDMVFNGMPNLKTLTIPDSVKEMEYSAIQGCDSLETLYLSDNLTMLDYYTAYNCYALKEITLGSKLQFIDSSAFYNCPNVEKLYFRGTVEQWNNIELEQNWNGNCFNAEFVNTNLNQVICSDGVTCIVHTGDGDTTCSTKPICEVCGHGFGTYKDHNFSIDSNPTYAECDEDRHYVSATCLDCGQAGYVEEYHETNPVENGDVYIDYDWGHRVESECSLCSAIVYEHESHEYIYDDEYIYVNPNGHSAKVSCDVCGFSEYWRYAHRGGESDCSTLAVCDDCGHSYGEYGSHKVDGHTCTICGTVGTVIETPHNPSYTSKQPYKVVGTWDYSGAKSVDLIIKCGTNGNVYGDRFYITEGTDWVEGDSSSGSYKNETRRYLCGGGGTINENLYKVSSYTSNMAAFVSNSIETDIIEDCDMLTGSVVFFAFKSYNSYGIQVIVIPNY